ncbi:MAG: AAA family ATPase [Bacteroidetes bacterium 4572_112]|nr:MAG: AAA family ATPase [Bacteroidetes bacterium 4572_112]
MKLLRKLHTGLIDGVSLDFQRYILNKLPWNERLVGIKGSRGVGKTTVLLQYIKLNYGQSDKALYISMDNFYFLEHRLFDFVEEFIAKGGEHLFIDEVHKYSNWSVELKNIYDHFPNLKVVFTGSSLLEILNSKSDLSRRALVYDMQGMSFREFLIYRYNMEFEPIGLDSILKNHTELSLDIGKKIKPLQYFSEYLRTGYFPFFDNNDELYYKRIQEVINMIIEIELPLLRNTDVSIIGKIKLLLYIISQSVPFKPNISALAKKMKVTRKTVLLYITYLQQAGVLNSIRRNSFGDGLLQKPEKIFLDNTNYMFAIMAEKPNIGNLRETFFLNQLSENYSITYPEKGDFLINEKYLFEVGGKSKGFKQIADIENSFIAADDIEFGVGNKIPLWIFGMMY